MPCVCAQRRRGAAILGVAAQAPASIVQDLVVQQHCPIWLQQYAQQPRVIGVGRFVRQLQRLVRTCMLMATQAILCRFSAVGLPVRQRLLGSQGKGLGAPCPARGDKLPSLLCTLSHCLDGCEALNTGVARVPQYLLSGQPACTPRAVAHSYGEQPDCTSHGPVRVCASCVFSSAGPPTSCIHYRAQQSMLARSFAIVFLRVNKTTQSR